MRILLFILISSLFNLVFAGPIPGVPNDLRRQFKSIHKFKEVEIIINDNKILARLDATNSQVALYYQIPKQLKDAVFKELIQKQIPLGLNFKFNRYESQEKYTEYQITINEKLIEESWIKVYETENEKLAIGMKIPSSSQVVKFDNFNDVRYFLHNKKIVAFREIKLSEEKVRVVFPKRSGLKDRDIKIVQAHKDQNGTIERISLPKGHFPDQIVYDEFGMIWFTQPNDSLLTSFDPIAKTWKHIDVGHGADGLMIGKDGKLWFGEYHDEHMGMYDPITNQYKRFQMPYSNSKPAIPYEGHDGLIWISDHARNKVSVFNQVTNSWNTYSPEEDDSWIVQLIQMNNGNNDIYATQCHTNSIGHIDYQTREYTDIPLGISGCPAFSAPAGDDLYISLWSKGSFVKLNTTDESITELQISNDLWKEGGIGPLNVDLRGNIYFASLSGGRVYRFNPNSKILNYIDGIKRTKDGLVVMPDGTVWITESAGALVKVNFSN